MCVENNLLHIKYPDIFKQISLNGNHNINLFSLTCGSSKKKILWNCEKGHMWDDNVAHRVSGRNCPYCSKTKKRVCKDNCLAVINPNLSVQWHKVKNVNNTPFDVTPKSNKIVWWICNNGHEWESSVDNRSRGRGCPYCSGRKVCVSNCLMTINPALCNEWDYEKNSTLTPFDVTQFSVKKVWWKCENGHSWFATISNRSSGAGCKQCNNPNVSKIELKFYNFFKYIFPNTKSSHNLNHNNKNVEIDIFIPEIGLCIEYDGFYFHSDQYHTQLDTKKNNIVKSKNLDLIRIREKGLPKICNNEFVHIPYPKSEFIKTAINVINYIADNYTLTEKQLMAIEKIKNL